MYSQKLLRRLREPKKDPLAFLRSQQLYGQKSHIIATVLVLIACLSVSAVAWYGANKSVKASFSLAADKRIEESNQAIGNRLMLISTVLSSGTGLFQASDQVTRSEWEAFVNSVYKRDMFPGVRAFGYVSYVRPGELGAYVASMQQSGMSNYNVAPVAGDQEIHVPVAFLAPTNTQRDRIVGYNMYADGIRREAIDTARDTGKMAASGKVNLINGDQDKTGQPGIVVFAPVYRHNTSTGSVEERRQNISGFTYAVITIDDLFKGIFGSEGNDDIAIEIYDNAEDIDDNLLYRSSNFHAITQAKQHYIQERTVNVTDHKWKITHAVGYSTLSQAERDGPFSSLLRGVILSLALSFFVYYLLTHRTRKILEAKHMEVQTAKDDLLSLASHQLRTPATVVKQYVGMLLQGYGGELNDQQKSMLGSAYASNERQLQIINQILYVARLDAGQIKLHKERISLNKLLKDVAKEHANSFKENKQKFTLRLPQKTVYIRADKQYLHMVLDNLLSNAGKYTPTDGKISISLTHSDGRAVISIKDNGVGITKDEMAAIFDKFTRGSSEMTSQVSGSGIGLYLVKKITELHRGNIIAKPNHPNGTVFELSLPLGISKRLKSGRKG